MKNISSIISKTNNSRKEATDGWRLRKEGMKLSHFSQLGNWNLTKYILESD